MLNNETLLHFAAQHRTYSSRYFKNLIKNDANVNSLTDTGTYVSFALRF